MNHYGQIERKQPHPLFISDNLPQLEGPNSETVDLILIDPPFNSKREFQGIGKASKAKFNDTWTWRENVHPEWMPKMREHNRALVEVIESAYHAHDPGMAAYIAWMSIRTLELHRVIKATGSMYLHCDPTASHYLKSMMDAIFGPEYFRNELVWRRTKGRSDAKRFGRVHDVILFYSKSDNFTWNTQYRPHDPEYIKRAYRNKDARGRWRSDQLTASGLRNGESGEPWRGIDPTDVGNHWRTPTQGGMNTFIIERGLIPGWPNAYPSIHSRLDALDSVGLIHWPVRGKMPSLKRYLESTKGTAVDDLFIDIGKLESSSKEKTGWATQKPLALYSRIIRASSNEGDIVLDAFAGCATTCVAAEQLGRQWVGIDIDDEAANVTVDRLRKETRSFSEVDAPTVDRPQLYVRREPPIRTPDNARSPTFDSQTA